MKVITELPRSVTATATLDVKVTGKVIFAGSNAHVIEAYVIQKDGAEFISVSRFDLPVQARIMEALAVEARDQERAHTEELAAAGGDPLGKPV